MDPKSFLASKTILFNLLMGLVSMGVLKGMPLTQDQFGIAVDSIAGLWTVGGILIRFFTHKPVTVSINKSTAGLFAFLCLAPLLLTLGACDLTTGQSVPPSTDTRIAQAEAMLATANFAAQEAISHGWIKEKDVPKVQAAIKAASLALDEARKAVADGELDAADAISAAIRAATDLPAIVSEFQAKT